MTQSRWFRLSMCAVCALLSLLWAVRIGINAVGGATGFRGVYFGTKCLMHGRDPYREPQLIDFYKSEGQTLPVAVPSREALTLYVNLPTTFLAVAPFAAMPWRIALPLWFLSTAGVFFVAVVLILERSATAASAPSLFLICLLLLNCEVLFATCNTAGIVVGLCVIAVDCFLKNRWTKIGVVCLGISLAIKPHDVGLVWLFFMLGGGINRIRALKSLLVTATLAVTALIWVSFVAPHWLPELRANLHQINASGGLNEPGPSSMTGQTPAMVIDLQAAISIFHDQPDFYNIATYMICGALLLIWCVRTCTMKSLDSNAWLALAAVVPLTLLFTYHRPYDAKILLLAIPACTTLWAQGNIRGRVAFLFTALGIGLTGDVPLAILVELFKRLKFSGSSIQDKMLALALTRPASVALFFAAIFYLWTYTRESGKVKG